MGFLGKILGQSKSNGKMSGSHSSSYTYGHDEDEQGNQYLQTTVSFPKQKTPREQMREHFTTIKEGAKSAVKGATQIGISMVRTGAGIARNMKQPKKQKLGKINRIQSSFASSVWSNPKPRQESHSLGILDRNDFGLLGGESRDLLGMNLPREQKPKQQYKKQGKRIIIEL